MSIWVRYNKGVAEAIRATPSGDRTPLIIHALSKEGCVNLYLKWELRLCVAIVKFGIYEKFLFHTHVFLNDSLIKELNRCLAIMEVSQTVNTKAQP